MTGSWKRALVLARAHAQDAIAPADPAHTPWANLRATVARLTHDPLPHARVLSIDRSGHDGINRAPDRVVAPLAAFLAGR